MLKLTVGYPDLAEETEILHRRHQRQHDDVVLKMITNAKQILAMRKVVETVHMDQDLEGYIAAVIQETRHDRHVAVGSSPRGSLAFLKMARAYAAMQGRDYVLPDDIKHFGLPVLSHRLILQPEYWLTRQVADRVIGDIFAKVPVPVLKGA
jgi:MoxR-like ATPase